MNILIITNLYPRPWEPNRATFNKQQFDLLAQRHNVRVLVPVAWRDYWKHRKLIKQSGLENVRYACYFYTPKILYFAYGMYMLISLCIAAWSWIKKVPCDVVLVSWAYPEGFAAKYIAKFLGCPYLLKVHGSDINVLTQDKLRCSQIVNICENASAVVCVSQALRNKLKDLKVSSDKLHIIYNGVNKSRFFPATDYRDTKTKTIVYIGNLKKDKGVLDLVHAFAQVHGTHPDYELLIIGSGPEKAELEKLVDHYGIHSNVNLAGVISHDMVASYLRYCSCLVLASYHEGVPNVLLEAAACGVPIIATHVGGIPEVVDEGVTGYLVNKGDIQGLAKVLTKCLDQSWDQDSIVKHAEKFDWNKNVAQLNQLLQGALKSIA